MKRLTKKDKRTKLGVNIPAYPTDFEKRIYLKLFDLENLEEELGIDLLTLFNAINSKSIWVKSYKIIEHIEDVYNERVWRLQAGHLYLYWENGSHCCLEISDYGKSWWLEKPKEINDD